MNLRTIKVRNAITRILNKRNVKMRNVILRTTIIRNLNSVNVKSRTVIIRNIMYRTVKTRTLRIRCLTVVVCLSGSRKHEIGDRSGQKMASAIFFPKLIIVACLTI